MLSTIIEDAAAMTTPVSLRAILASTTPVGATCVQALAEHGSRWRPLLYLAAWRGVTESLAPVPANVKQVLVALECFHKASLIHDDIEDDDLDRYGLPTLHVTQGLGPAINVGDLLVGYGYRLIAEADLPPMVTVRILKAVSNAHCRLCEGQGRELQWRQEGHEPDSAELCEMFALKTGAAFDAALTVGAILANAEPELLETLSAVASPLGVTYQLLDDAADGDPSDAAPAARDYAHRTRLAVAQISRPSVRVLLHGLLDRIIGPA
jgi:geranylgeranyl diphosphate synthase, type II